MCQEKMPSFQLNMSRYPVIVCQSNSHGKFVDLKWCQKCDCIANNLTISTISIWHRHLMVSSAFVRNIHFDFFLCEHRLFMLTSTKFTTIGANYLTPTRSKFAVDFSFGFLPFFNRRCLPCRVGKMTSCVCAVHWKRFISSVDISIIDRLKQNDVLEFQSKFDL